MKASKAPSTGYCGIPALSISSLETSNGLLWMAARPTADNHNVWGVSTAWDRDTLAQDEIKTQLGIHSDAKAFAPQFYVASSGIRGVTAIAKRAAVGVWEYSPKSAEVVMNNILHLDKNTFAYLSGVPSMLEDFTRPGSQGAPLLVANGSLLLQGNDLYYSPEPYAFDIKEGFNYVSKCYYPSTCSVYKVLASLVYTRTRHKK